MQLFGIDISKHQGDFNLSQAIAEGVSFVIIKACGHESTRYTDSQFENNYRKCKELGIPVGAYFFGGGDKSIEDAKQSAEQFLAMLKGKQFEYPVYYDVEADILNLDKKLLNQIIDTFCSIVQSNGYYTGIYASASPFSTHITDTKFTHWVASYGKTKPSTRNLDIWQYGGKDNFLRSNIIAGVVCDQDFCYKDFPTIIKEKKLNGFGKENMNNAEFVGHLINIVNMPTYYSNKYPNNLGYVHEDGRRSFDCWNLIKAVLNGYNEFNNTVGYYQKDLSKTGDTTADGLIKQCHNVSTDFSKIIYPGAFLYYYDGTHAGTFVGDHEIGGKHYNVIECTAAWDKRVLWSWVDADGTRRQYKGSASKSGRWSKYGYFNMLGDETQGGGTPIPGPTPDPEPTPTPTPTSNVALPTVKLGSSGANAKLLQHNLNKFGYGLAEDGDFGTKSDAALRGWQLAVGLKSDGIYGNDSYNKMKTFF